MHRYLIVANQTLGGDELDRTIRERLGRGEARFLVLVPTILPSYEAPAWTFGFPTSEPQIPEPVASGFQRDQRRREARFEARAEARRRAERRLEQMLETIRAAGGDADGVLGGTDPAEAVRQVLRDQSFDEVIISTLPSDISRWLRVGLPGRVARMTRTPVTTIEAGEDR